MEASDVLQPPDVPAQADVVPSESAGTQAAAGAPSEQSSATEGAPEPSVPDPAPETAEAAAAEGQEPTEASPEAAEGMPGASPERPAADEAEVPLEDANPGYLGQAPGDEGFEPKPGTPKPPNNSPAARMEAETVGYFGARSGESPRRGL